MASDLRTSDANEHSQPGLHSWGNLDAGARSDADPRSTLSQARAESPAAVSSLARILFRIFDALCCGAILLDGAKQPIHLNDRASKFYGECLSVRCGRLCAADRGSDALFQTMMDQALDATGTEAQGGPEAIALKRSDSRPVIARAIPVDMDAQAQLGRTALVLLLIDPDDCPQPSSALLKHVFGLTAAEARIATDLLCGRSVHEAAEQNDVSVGTIRCQTKAIFAKTQTKRQSDLVGLLTRLAVISNEPGADRHDAAGPTAPASSKSRPVSQMGDAGTRDQEQRS